MSPVLTTRPATRDDVPLILTFIKDLAEYERLSHEVMATEKDLTETLFGPRPGAEVLLGFTADEPVAFALFFSSYSTFLAKSGIYLEDLFVRPAWRGKGFGKAMLSVVAKVAVERGCGRLEWSCLDWNEPSIGFYKSLGAQVMDEWTVYRLTGKTLMGFAGAD
ncbi:GNAT family N-acetyltransferase [Desulfocurvibacter africanus]|uniref:GCN5-related N-acetyltransferase n=1 Tax=Desulfocurvibacter africanus subsp. africanus str. Walvis Bay TaxID=690850 RepID=F3Z241_DESAF|nr:GNAT family N-acetyltransferase [Desulfocurvibacter africanus]EGJ51250.1 GCN5-related N-acetyltransferase [Desulfocurvibacter africanus subsp. africanus str. Walvis Bay]